MKVDTQKSAAQILAEERAAVEEAIALAVSDNLPHVVEVGDQRFAIVETGHSAGTKAVQLGRAPTKPTG